ncbi:MAG TPA: YbhB/YbcL family Raf kinase inhibitor-like protein [Candidatus Binataceae bacterium]|nr:YbhB/YbcL family Raf kinase inhibitor-like protein [Candidatus Binataceae bacterium]
MIYRKFATGNARRVRAMRSGKIEVFAILGLTLILIGFSAIPAFTAQNQALSITSPAFRNGDTIPTRYTCSGENISPALKWNDVPQKTESIALIVDDPDAPNGMFVHWVFFNLPAGAGGLPENVRPSKTAEGGTQGLNGRGQVGYTGPCPPPGAPHHYHFRLYALDRKLSLNSAAGASEVESGLKGHVLAASELVGIFGR